MCYRYDEDSSEIKNIAYALYGIANELSRLGNGNANTHFGAIEGLAMKVNEGLKEVATSIDGLSSVVEYKEITNQEEYFS